MNVNWNPKWLLTTSFGRILKGFIQLQELSSLLYITVVENNSQLQAFQDFISERISQYIYNQQRWVSLALSNNVIKNATKA